MAPLNPLAAVDCSNCLGSKISDVLKENEKLKKQIDNLKSWLLNIPEDWMKDPGELRNQNLEPGELMNQELEPGELMNHELETGELMNQELEQELVAGVQVFLPQDEESSSDPTNTELVLVNASDAFTIKQEDEDEQKVFDEENETGSVLGGGWSYTFEQGENSADTTLAPHKHKKVKQHQICEPEIVCDQCDFTASTKECLKYHILKEHVGTRLTCEQCEYATTNAQCLRFHIENKHLGIKYPCDQCNFVGSVLHSLRYHKRNKHEGIRYQCDHCAFVSARKYDLKLHKKRKHEKIKHATRLK